MFSHSWLDYSGQLLDVLDAQPLVSFEGGSCLPRDPSFADDAKPAAGTGSFSLDFVAGTYTVNGTSYALTAIPGYSYSRTGSLIVLDSDGTVDSFSANTAPVNGFGLHHYDALTNLITQSQNIVNGAGAWFAAAVTTTADTTVAPDGTTTADTANMTGTGHALAAGISLLAGQNYTFSFFALRGTATDAKLSVHDGTADVIASTSYYSQTNGSTFSRIVQGFTPVRTSSHNVYPLRDSGVTGTIFLWQAQLIQGSAPPEGGPIIPTTTAAASTGQPTFTFTLADGLYDVLYTFDDSSTRIVQTLVTGNVFSVAAWPTIPRGRIKSISVAGTGAGNASAAGSSSTASAPAATATGDAAATSSGVTATSTAPSATGTVSVAAAASGATASSSTPAATATGGATGTASGIADNATAPSSSASGGGAATAAGLTDNSSAPSATGSGAALATVSGVTVSATAPSATATAGGSGAGSAAGVSDTATAPTAAATGTASASALGATATAAAPSSTASAGGNSTAAGVTATVSAPSASAFVSITASALGRTATATAPNVTGSGGAAATSAGTQSSTTTPSVSASGGVTASATGSAAAATQPQAIATTVTPTPNPRLTFGESPGVRTFGAKYAKSGLRSFGGGSRRSF